MVNDFNCDSELMMIRWDPREYEKTQRHISGEIQGTYYDARFIPAGKPWAECPTASGIFFRYFMKRIDGMTLENFKEEGEDIEKNLKKAFNEQYMPESSIGLLKKNLSDKIMDYVRVGNMQNKIEERDYRRTLLKVLN